MPRINRFDNNALDLSMIAKMRSENKSLKEDNAKLVKGYDELLLKFKSVADDKKMLIVVLAEIIKTFGNGTELNLSVDPDSAITECDVEFDATDIANGNIKLKIKEQGDVKK